MNVIHFNGSSYLSIDELYDAEFNKIELNSVLLSSIFPNSADCDAVLCLLHFSNEAGKIIGILESDLYKMLRDETEITHQQIRIRQKNKSVYENVQVHNNKRFWACIFTLGVYYFFSENKIPLIESVPENIFPFQLKNIFKRVKIIDAFTTLSSSGYVKIVYIQNEVVIFPTAKLFRAILVQ